MTNDDMREQAVDSLVNPDLELTPVDLGDVAQRPALAVSRWRLDRREVIERGAMPVVLLLAVGVFSILLPDQFPTSGNINAILSTEAVPLILALAVLLPLRANYFDLSIAQIMVLSGALSAVLTVEHHWNLGAALVVAALAGILCGIVNSALTVILNLNSFIVTLGTSSVITGFVYWITNANSIQPLPSGLVTLTTKIVLGEPLMVWYAWILAIAMWLVLEYTPYGRYLLFIGGSRQTADLIGINTRLLSISTYVIEAVLASFAGVLLAGSLDTVNPSIGAEFLLTPYAAAFLGAAAIQIGRFNVVGTVLAVYLVAVGETGLILLGAPTWASNVFDGAILIIAITFSRVVRRRG